MKLEAPESFDDVAVTFSDEEWDMLNEEKKKLYWEVMMQNYEMMISLGYCIPMDELLALIERGKMLPICSVTEMKKGHKDCLETTQNFTKCVDFSSKLQEESEQFADKGSFKYTSHQGSFAEQQPLVKSSSRKHNIYSVNKCFVRKVKNEDGHVGDLTSESNTCKRSPSGSPVVDEHQMSVKPFQCTEREGSISCEQHVAKHPLTCTDKQSKCSNNGKDHKQKSELKKQQSDKNNMHVRANYMEYMECSSSKKLYSNDKYQNISFADKPYKCVECGRCYKNKAHLKRHMLNHTGMKPYKCGNCGKSYTRKDQLLLHQRVHADKKPFECTLCEKGYTRKGDFIAHQKMHMGESTFNCTDCGRSFQWRQSLLQHQLMHTEVRIKPYKCVKCGKSFGNKSHLIRHELIHTEVKPFKCTECERSFRYRQHLTRHQVIHTIKPFKCEECGKRFRRKYELLSHHSVHTGERPFKCSKCWRSFPDKAHVFKHEKLHSQEYKIKCTDCGKILACKASFSRHQLLLHTDNK